MRHTARLLMVFAAAVMLLSSMAGMAFAGINEWTTNGPIGGDIRAIVVSPNFATDQTVFAGDITGGGVFKTTDGGAIWNAVNNGLTNTHINTLAVSPSYATDHTVFAGDITGGGMFKTTDGGANWTAVNTGLTSTNIFALSVSPNYDTDHTVFAGDSTGGGVFKTTNGGISWTAVLASTPISALSVSPNYATDQTVYAGGVCEYSSSDFMFKTSNGGTSWNAVNNGLPDMFGIYWINALSVSPNYSTDHTVFAGTTYDGVYKTTDGGANWFPVDSGITITNITALSVSPTYSTSHTVFAGTNGGGVFKTIDGGANWIAVNTGIAGLSTTYSFAVSPNYELDGTVYAGTDSAGVFSNTFVPPTTVITKPANGDLLLGTTYSITGTASAAVNASVQKVEVAVAGEWHDASDTSGIGSWSSWSYDWAPHPLENHSIYYTIRSRATDSLNNVETPSAGVTVTVVDMTKPSSVIYTPANGATLSGVSKAISGDAFDMFDGVQKVEVGITPDGGTETWYTATGTPSWSYNWTLPADGGYTIRSRATDIAGNVEDPGAGFTVTVDNTCATPASLTVPASSSTGSYTVSWGTSATAGVTYTLQEATNSAFTTGIRTAYTGTALTASITGRTSGTYYYRVLASKTGYTASAWRTAANGCAVSIPCATPASLTVPATSSTGSYTVSWGASSTTGVTYTLQEATNATFTTGVRTAYTGATLTASITGRAKKTTYYYRVKATKTGYSASAWRNGANNCKVAGGTPITCGVPSSITVPVSSLTTSYTVRWGASATAGVTYSLQEATNSTFTTGLRTAYTGTTLSKAITGRTRGKTYYYRVKATKTGATTSAWRKGANGCRVQ